MKPCFKCNQEKPLDQFYKHPKMADGHVNKCKECNKKDVNLNRVDKLDYYREYDRKRGNRQTSESLREYREKYPGKYRAHTALGNAVRKGLMVPDNCQTCGSSENIHGHHDDYAKPLNVRWLCAACHKAWHLKHGEAPNG